MKHLGGVTYIGVSLKDLNKYFKDDAVIHVSKKFIKSYEMISGITETSKPIEMNVVDKTEVIAEEPIRLEQPVGVAQPVAVVVAEKEAAPPVELNISKGDW
tara:strand:+ start:860 stop:1162 length:303 start_codon:yes stop_codon:yes gene_type:complete